MTRNDFVRVVGGQGPKADYVPVVLLLKSGYACAGHFNEALNQGFSELVVLINAQLIELQSSQSRSKPAVRDFSEFLSELIANGFESASSDFGRPTPIAAIPVAEVAVVYPVAQIETLVRRAEHLGEGRGGNSFLDLGRSEVLSLLRTKLW